MFLRNNIILNKVIKKLLKFKFVFVLIILSSCAASPDNRLTTAQTIAENAGLKEVSLKADKFNIKAFVRQRDKKKPLVVYIEGDGLAFVRNGVSPDPTPINPIGLKLAAIDKGDNVLYVARPCQYQASKDEYCSNFYWTDGRFSSEVLSSIKAVVDYFASEAEGIHLVGYSGGAALAALIAEEEPDRVLSLRTVAGNLDHDAVNQYHKVPLQNKSLNPKEKAKKLRDIPQIHYLGNKDKVIPFFVVSNFVKAVSNISCTKIVTIEGAGHSKGIADFWRNNYQDIPNKCF
ncbi:MAG: alpha/beta hydrolase [Alphaproteobacteria bacterium]